jgi:peptide/nickel transport system permease protein
MKKNLYLFSKKFFSYLLTLFLLVTLIFFLIRFTPGDPAAKYLSPELSKDLAEKVRTSFNLDKPVLVQYTSFVKNMFTGDFGISYQYHRPVFEVIREYLLFTVLFALTSFAIQFFAGLKYAVYVVKKGNKLLTRLSDSIALGIYSVPTFIIGIMLIYLFSHSFKLFPSADLYSLNFSEKDFFARVYEIFIHSVLPLATLSLPGIVIFYRYAKENIYSIKEKSFIRYLYSNGVEEKEIYKGHIIPNILPQLISLSGVELSILLSGALITEVLFNLPGMGRITVTAIVQRDYPLLLASTFISGVFVLLCNFTAEILRGAIDKRLIKEVYS